jgi:enoyl-CoA hydratase/3-hydroxyacyl-CoA dehydrogenase
MGNGNPLIVEANALKMEEGEHYRHANIFRSVEKWDVPRPGTKVDVPDKVRKLVRDRMLGLLFSQSFDIIDRRIGTREDLNFGCQVALGFRKGPLDIRYDLGEAEVERISQKFKKDRPGFPQANQSFPLYQDFRPYLLVDNIDDVKIITIRRPQPIVWRRPLR